VLGTLTEYDVTIEYLQTMQQLVHGNLEALTQASFIFILAIALVLSNFLIVATLINFRGESPQARLVMYFKPLTRVLDRSPRGH
jgi:hypothetical protein